MPVEATIPPAIERDALRGISVLVVDDEPVLASTFCLVLQFAGATSHSAANGRIALAMLAYQNFDVILCDKQMPVMTGVEFIRELKKRGNSTPVLLFVNTADGRSSEEASVLEIAGVVSKPILPAELISAIRNVVRPTVKNMESNDPGASAPPPQSEAAVEQQPA